MLAILLADSMYLCVEFVLELVLQTMLLYS